MLPVMREADRGSVVHIPCGYRAWEAMDDFLQGEIVCGEGGYAHHAIFEHYRTVAFAWTGDGVRLQISEAPKLAHAIADCEAPSVYPLRRDLLTLVDAYRDGATVEIWPVDSEEVLMTRGR